MWLLGVPIPILLLLYVLRGCTLTLVPVLFARELSAQPERKLR